MKEMGYKRQLDGLRAICFLGVFLFHTDSIRFWWGAYGVHVFFALSGFLITKILLTHENSVPTGDLIKSFYIRRFLRIFPAYYMILILLLIFASVPYMTSIFFYVYNIKLFLLSLAGKAGEVALHWNEWGMHFWSLSVEEQFYIIYPILFLYLAKKYRAQFFVLSILLSILVTTAFKFAASTTYYGYLPFVCGEYILWGCFLAYLEHHGKLSKIPRDRMFYYCILAFVVYCYLRDPPRYTYSRSFITIFPGFEQTITAVLFALLIWSLWHADSDPVAKALAWGPLAYFGKISYGLYLIHPFMWNLFDIVKAKWEVLNGVPVFLGRLSLTVFFAVLSWHFFENPINKMKVKVPYGFFRNNLSRQDS